MKKNIISMAAAMAVLSACGPGVPQLGKSSLDEVIGAMTLEEKAHLVVGTGMAGFSGDSAVIGATRKLVPGAAGTTYPGLTQLQRTPYGAQSAAMAFVNILTPPFAVQ